MFDLIVIGLNFASCVVSFFMAYFIIKEIRRQNRENLFVNNPTQQQEAKQEKPELQRKRVEDNPVLAEIPKASDIKTKVSGIKNGVTMRQHLLKRVEKSVGGLDAKNKDLVKKVAQEQKVKQAKTPSISILHSDGTEEPVGAKAEEPCESQVVPDLVEEETPEMDELEGLTESQRKELFQA